MKKLKKQKLNNLLKYSQFLKNNYLKNNKFKLKNILFNDQILYKNSILEASIIEFNNYENIYLPFTLIKISEISTIDLKYKNILLFNYDLTYNILKQFNKIMFPYAINFIDPKNILIKGRVLGGTRRNKKILISILGYIFTMKPKKLHIALDFRKRFYFNKYNKKGLYKKKINATQLINCYKFKYLNFKINDTFNKKINNFKKKQLSRLSYVRFILKLLKIKKRRKNKHFFKKKQVFFQGKNMLKKKK